jgi:exodeoxyribonuclease V alpha subunit
MLQLITRRIPSKFGFNPIHDIQVLTPMRRNQLGAENLNGLLQQALNPTGGRIAAFRSGLPRRRPRHADP